MISAITFINPAYSVKKKSNSGKDISFCGISGGDAFVPNMGKTLSKFKQYSIDEYKTLTEGEKQYLRDTYMTFQTSDDKFVEDFHDEFTDKLKAKLDRKYGKGKYVVITIGRSLSSVGKVLGYKIGEENVKNIPLTDAEKYLNPSRMKTIEKDGKIAEFNEFLCSMGLDKEKIKNSGKTYIITDFCVSGNSLKGATKLLKREDVLGGENIVSKDVLKYISNKKLREYAKGSFFTGLFKEYSFVNRAETLDKVPQAIVNTEDKSLKVRLMWFKLLDNQMKKTDKKLEHKLENPFSKDNIMNFFRQNRFLPHN